MTQRLFAATHKGLFRLERGRAGWEIAQVHFLGEPVSAVLPDSRDGSVYAATYLGHFGAKTHRSGDGGAHFEEIAAPQYPQKPGAEAGEDPHPWSLEMLWALEAGGAEEPGVLWAGSIPGGLFRSADRGDTWQLQRPLWDLPQRKQWMGGGYDWPGIHSVLVDPRDSRCLSVGVSIGGVWRTENAGESWQPRTQGMFADYMPPEQRDLPESQDPHRIAQCRAAPDTLWCQHHNGAFRSTNGGASWSELKVPPSSFGFAVAAHPQDSGTAWFVPAVKDECRVPVDGKLVVARTRNGGQSFDLLRAGLPQQHCYDLVYRHALEVDGAGQCLALGSTCGGLWLSEDAGDNWRAFSNTLPPIRALRFAD